MDFLAISGWKTHFKSE